jgi:hypothetical protein
LDRGIIETKGIIGLAYYTLIVRIGIIPLRDNIVKKAFNLIIRIINYLNRKDT